VASCWKLERRVVEGTRAGASEKDVFVWEGPCRSRRWVDRGNNQHTVGLVHRVHGRFDASRDHPSRPCWTAQFMSHDDIYFVLYCIFGTWLRRFALFTIFATVSQTAPHHAELHETSSLPRLQRHSFVPSQPAVIETSPLLLVYHFTSSHADSHPTACLWR
jgi:hypothetical protein